MSYLHWRHLWEGSNDMKLEMKFTERDKKLIVFLSLFLLIVGVGYFVVRPLYLKVDELQMQADDLEMQVAQTQSYLARLPQLRKVNEELKNDKQQALQDFYPYMESQELDKMITGLTLHESLGAKNLTITIPDAPYEITPYFLSVPQEEEGEQLSDSEQAYEDEKSDDTSAENAQNTDAQTDGTQTGDAQVQDAGEAQILYVAKLSIDVTGSHDQLQSYIDLLSDDAKYPAIQVDSYTWNNENSVSTDELGAFMLQSGEALHVELSVYMQGKEEE